jgi:hypothetical protein
MVKKVNIMGTTYMVSVTSADKNKLLNDCDGYCDRYSKTIVISDSMYKDFDTDEQRQSYVAKVFRHEVIHAVLAECGLVENSWGNNEEIVDWIAEQFPRLQSIFKLWEGGE